MKNRIILATQNKDKIREIKKILGNKFKIIELKKHPNIVENGKTLEENAIKKAKIIFNITRKNFKADAVLADDSGLEVDILGGKPGVYSARFAGKNCTYTDNNIKLLKFLKNVPYKKRRARFRTVVAIIFNNGRIKTTEGRISGYIITEPKGIRGFGYDPVFYYPKLKKTLAQLTAAGKNKISHRAIAFKKAKRLLLKT
ncbi:MAG: RdgB/HAM1 family non-canonical purine NTP pyrophosphatase [Elusimicrobia bacterium]|nr:RdgB/HAM1 family non-canonical purine NTP pyrophosphatase [Elusimicrobiota bacterium]